MESSCPQCHGIWVSQVALRRLMNYELAKEPPADESLEDLAATVAGTNSTSTLYCPECHVALLREQIHPLIPVNIDRCGKCNYIWFDAGEQRLMLRLYRELKKTDDAWLIGERDKLDRLEGIYQRTLPGIDKVDDDIHKISKGVVAIAEATQPGSLIQGYSVGLAITAIGKVVDWFLSFVMPTP
jgi:Zn-finger nucleic acid-binding protein